MRSESLNVIIIGGPIGVKEHTTIISQEYRNFWERGVTLLRCDDF